jgi:hypothetical protein
MFNDIKDFPGYKVSDSGEIISVRQTSTVTLKQQVKTHGYLYVTLYRNGKRYFRRVHRLVAEAFIPNPLNLPEVNHIDEDKTNNRVANLEWCTSYDNKVYGSRRDRVARKVSDPNIPRANNTSGRKGVSRTKNGKYVAYFYRKHLGTFDTFDEAVKAREQAESKFF